MAEHAIRGLLRRIRVGLPWIGGTLVALAVGGLLFAWSGIYNVGASSGHWGVTVTFLNFALHSSARTHSLSVEPPPLDDGGLVRLGARHFAEGCAPCHGAPGVARGPIVRNMVPQPPPLSEAVAEWDDSELYWIVRHGLKYTGMPAWVAQRRDDEVWAMVAFVRRLPGISPDDYTRLAGYARTSDESASLRRGQLSFGAAPDCGRCHDTADSAPVSRAVPWLGGQSAAYLEATIRDYAAGRRHSGFMQPVAARLDKATIVNLASHYAAMKPPTQVVHDPEAVVRGQRVATEGVREARIPPCISCHGEHRRDTFPRLDGQSAVYLSRQLELFREGTRGDTPGSEIMEAVARRLTDDQIASVAAYFASAGSVPDVETPAEDER